MEVKLLENQQAKRKAKRQSGKRVPSARRIRRNF
jgi:hypothetical protein